MTPRTLLVAALAADPARPLLTFYDDRSGERAELSVATFGNWVAKTANLLVDGLAAQPGDRVALHLPLHWQSAVWLSACWATGLVAAPGAAEAEIAVVAADSGGGGPESRERPPPRADEVVSMGLGPLGLPRRDATPPSYATLDYDREIHSYGDRFAGLFLDAPEAPALEVDGGTLSSEDVGEQAGAARARWDLPPRTRILCAAAFTGLQPVLAGLLVPLAGDVTAVLCRHLDPELAPARVEQEAVVAGSGLPPGVLPGLPRLT